MNHHPCPSDSATTSSDTSLDRIPPVPPVPPALCVDLDGTLLAGDATAEAALAMIRQHPVLSVLMPIWLLRGGRALLKDRVANYIRLDPTLLPYRPSVVEYVRSQKAAGRTTILATASHHSTAHGVAEHLGIFDQVIASDARHNVKSTAKVDAIRRRLGAGAFDYMGDSFADIPVWEAAGNAIMVNPSPRLLRQVEASLGPARLFADSHSRILAGLAAMRPAQWAKNLLLAIPMLVGHLLTVGNFLAVVMAIICFSLCASAIYLINDLLDLEADRQHPTKRNRPFAAGKLSVTTGLGMVGGLLVLGVGLALLAGLPWAFIGLLGGYLLLTSSYSLYFKQKVLVDAILLSGLYTLRVLAGGLAIGIMASFWLLAFSAFMFLSLAFAKRYTELLQLKDMDRVGPSRRGYVVGDLDILRMFGTANGYLAVLIFCLYINSPDVLLLYTHPKLLWFVGPVLLYWISRLWLLAGRGHMDTDPVVWTLNDRHSYVAGFIILLLIRLASG